VSLRLVEDDFSRCVDCDFKVPCIRAFDRLFIWFFFLRDLVFCWRDIVHVSRRNSWWKVELVESVLIDCQFWKVRNRDFDLFVRANIANLQIHYVVAFGINFRIDCLFSLFDCLVVFFLGFFFFLDDSFNSFVSKLCNKFVDTRIGVDGKTEINFQKLFRGISIYLL
jgi:hypothetical protein